MFQQSTQLKCNFFFVCASTATKKLLQRNKRNREKSWNFFNGRTKGWDDEKKKKKVVKKKKMESLIVTFLLIIHNFHSVNIRGEKGMLKVLIKIGNYAAFLKKTWQPVLELSCNMFWYRHLRSLGCQTFPFLFEKFRSWEKKGIFPEYRFGFWIFNFFLAAAGEEKNKKKPSTQRQKLMRFYGESGN